MLDISIVEVTRENKAGVVNRNQPYAKTTLSLFPGFAPALTMHLLCIQTCQRKTDLLHQPAFYTADDLRHHLPGCARANPVRRDQTFTPDAQRAKITIMTMRLSSANLWFMLVPLLIGVLIPAARLILRHLPPKDSIPIRLWSAQILRRQTF